jgi:hypothetical protein
VKRVDLAENLNTFGDQPDFLVGLAQRRFGRSLPIVDGPARKRDLAPVAREGVGADGEDEGRRGACDYRDEHRGVARAVDARFYGRVRVQDSTDLLCAGGHSGPS